MVLTDQQLRQELLSFGETVPPITQRNREQLRARLDILRAQRRSSPVKSSPSRARSNVSSGRTSTRSRAGRGLIELSDSEADRSPSSSRTPSRSPVRSQHAQTRSVAVGRDTDRVISSPSGNVTADVEQSIARHRREIEQLINSTREKSRASHSNFSSPRQEPLPSTTPFRPQPSTSRSRSTYKAGLDQQPKAPSWFQQSKSSIQQFWKNNGSTILNLLKALLVGGLLGVGLIFLANKGKELIPQPKRIYCSPDNATTCEHMPPIINSLRTYLQTRTGEVDCGFRPKTDLYATRSDVDKILDKQGFIFQDGPQTRWETIVSYIFKVPETEIEVFTDDGQHTDEPSNAYKLRSSEGIHPLLCRIRRNVHSAMQHLAWIVLGTTGILSLAWFVRRRAQQYEQSEKTYKEFVGKILELLEEQYEQHNQDSETKPWLAISHIKDMLIPAADRKKMKSLWERAKKQISESESRIRAETQLIHGEEYEVWRWIQPRSPSPQRRPRSESPANTHEESYVYMPPDVGLTQCLKLRNFFDPNTPADDDEIDLVVDSIQSRCATVRRIEHIGIHAIYVYLKFSSKEAAAQGFHLLNNWKYHGREIIAKYLRLERYHEHFPEARESGTTNN